MSGIFILHGSPHSLPTYRVALMLRLCGVGFRFRYVSFQRRTHLTPEFRALSRWGQVPVLEHDGRMLLQSAAILEYLSETFNRFGGGGTTRQDIREWLFWDADRLYPPLYGWYGVDLGRRGLSCRCPSTMRSLPAGKRWGRRRWGFSTRISPRARSLSVPSRRSQTSPAMRTLLSPD